MGTPALYTFEVRQGDQVVTRKVGFRRTRLVMHEGAWRIPENFPKGPSNPPITLEINGRRIFAKGSNWVSPDVFPGTLNAERYRQQLQIARDSNMNILRMWGGAPAQKEAFYQIADELGLMIWQEFPLACNNYADDPHYLQILDQESRSLITRLRQHPCVVLFCGGNELFNSWSGMTEQSHALRLLDRNCYDLAPDRPFIKTSPIMGMGHGHYCFRDMKPAIESWALFQRSACTAYTEFGMAGASPFEVLKRTKTAEKLQLMLKPAVGRKDLGEGLHFQGGTIEHYFGEQTSLEEWVRLSHWLQGEGYRGLFEEVRRQKPIASMAINWCFNEPWPNLANLSLIAYPTEPKASMKEVAQALRPVIASARIKQFQWKEGELLDAELWILSDRYEQIPAGQLRASLYCGGQEIPLLTWEFAEVALNTNHQGPRIQYRLPHFGVDHFELRLSIAGRSEADSSYLLSYNAKVPKA